MTEGHSGSSSMVMADLRTGCLNPHPLHCTIFTIPRSSTTSGVDSSRPQLAQARSTFFSRRSSQQSKQYSQSPVGMPCEQFMHVVAMLDVGTSPLPDGEGVETDGFHSLLLRVVEELPLVD
jgi:hypothetical protein